MVLTSWEKGPFAFVRRSMCLYRSEIPAPCFGDQQSKSLPEWRNRVQQTAKSPLLARHIGSLRAGNQTKGMSGCGTTQTSRSRPDMSVHWGRRGGLIPVANALPDPL